jgi:serine/threonine protein kinase
VVNHPFIVRYIGCTLIGVGNPKLAIVMEWMPATLTSLVRKDSPNRLARTPTLKWLNSVAQAVKYLDDMKWMHRDIKPDNILVGSFNLFSLIVGIPIGLVISGLNALTTSLE